MKFLLIVGILLICRFPQAQLGNHFFGGTGDDVFYNIKPSADGGYFLLGAKTEESSNVWLVKVDSSLNIIWERTYSHPNPERNEIGYNLIYPDSSYMYIVGKSYGTGKKGLVFKVDSEGNEVWKEDYSETAVIYDLVHYGNNVLVCGYKDRTGILLNIDTNGEVISTLELEILDETFIKKIQPLQDGGFIIIGLTNRIGAGFSGLFMRKINSSLEPIWTQFQETTSREYYFEDITTLYDSPLSAVLSEDSTLWITSDINSTKTIGLFSFDMSGTNLSSKYYGTGYEGKFPTSLVHLSDGGWLIGGTTDTDSTFALRIGPDGIEKWFHYYWDKDTKDICFSSAISDSGFLLSGMVQRSVQDNSDFDGTIFRIEEDGNAFPYKFKGTIKYDRNENCLSDSLDNPLPHWFVTVSSTEQSYLLATNPDGEFVYNTSVDSFMVMIHNPDTLLWTLCDNNTWVKTDSLQPELNLTFLAKPNKSCGKLEVGLTQPEYIKCKTSCLTATVQNRGNLASDFSLLRLKLDPEFSLVSVSTPYDFTNKVVEIVLPPIFEHKAERVELCVSLNCDVQLGATHNIEAQLVPDACSVPYHGPFFEVEGWCNEDNVVFSMQNTGGGGALAKTYYSVYVNAELLVDQKEIKLPEGGEPKTITFPADGRTWRVQLNQDSVISSYDTPSSTVEACGSRSTGWHDVGYKNAFLSNDLSPLISMAISTNTTGGPNKIVEATQGLGKYNIISEIKELSYTARVLNELEEDVTNVILDLTFSPNLDLRTFRIISSLEHPVLEVKSPSTIRLILENTFLQKGDYAMVRFCILPVDSIAPNNGYQSFIQIQAKAYLNGIGPVELDDAFHNYVTYEQAEIEGHSTYPESMLAYGGRNIDFGVDMFSNDGELYMCGSSYSFGSGSERSGYVMKTDSMGRIQWYSSIKSDFKGAMSISGIISDGEDGCIYVGSFRKSADPDYANFSYGVIGRIGPDGNTIWSHLIKPSGEQNGGNFSGIIHTHDGNYLVYGSIIDDGSQSIYVKINRNGDILWKSENHAYRILPETGVSLPDGNFLFSGRHKNSFSSLSVLQKVDAQGKVLWEKLVTVGNPSSFISSVIPLDDRQILLAGTSYWEHNGDHITTPLFITYDSMGTKLSESKPLLGDGIHVQLYDIISAKVGGYLGTGQITTVSGIRKLPILKFDDDLEFSWLREFGKGNWEAGLKILNPSSDRIYCWGYDQGAPIIKSLQSILVTTNGDGLVTHDGLRTITESSYKTKVFPNPASGFANVLLSPIPEKDIHWIVTNTFGQKILSGFYSGQNFLRIETSNLPSGTYFLTFPGSDYKGKQLMIIH